MTLSMPRMVDYNVDEDRIMISRSNKSSKLCIVNRY